MRRSRRRRSATRRASQTSRRRIDYDKKKPRRKITYRVIKPTIVPTISQKIQPQETFPVINTVRKNRQNIVTPSFTLVSALKPYKKCRKRPDSVLAAKSKRTGAGGPRQFIPWC